ncbi:MAG: class I SAM-dependent methyltransferase [archaeon]
MKKTQRIFWNEHYRKHGDSWRGVSKINADLKGKKVLEIGCGSGKTLSSIISKAPKKIVAIDFSETAVAIAKPKFFDKAEVIRAECTKLPFKNKSFDAIFCTHVLGALVAKDRIKCASEMRRVLAKDGTIFFEDFAKGDLREKGTEIEKNTFQKKNGIIQHFFTKKEVLGIFKQFENAAVLKKSVNLRLGKRKVKRAEIIAQIKK